MPQAAGTVQVTQVNTAKPVDDMRALISAGKVDEAVNQTVEVIFKIVEGAVMSRLFRKAADTASELRSACVDHNCPPIFNNFLKVSLQQIC